MFLKPFRLFKTGGDLRSQSELDRRDFGSGLVSIDVVTVSLCRDERLDVDEQQFEDDLLDWRLGIIFTDNWSHSCSNLPSLSLISLCSA